jgi:hypothetical protein
VKTNARKRVALDKLATLIWINAQASFVVDLAAEAL